ncbi:MAG TPA: peptidylprolyl isomerase [Burkholderiales bacterium]
MKKIASLLLAGLLASGPLYAQNIAKVNGVAIPTSRADAMVNQLASQQGQGQGQGQPNLPQLRERVKDQLITYELISQEASKSGLSKQPDVAMQLDLARQTVLFRAFLQDYVKKNPVSDADIKTKYDALKAEQTKKEYLARHILVKTEDEAKAVITKLKGGAKFEDLAKQQSIDPSNKDKGGVLDWAPADVYDPDFSKVMVGLAKGQTTDTPVKTRFGWHVIRLDDVRESFPPLDQVRPQVTQVVQQERITKMLEEMRAKAKIE